MMGIESYVSFAEKFIRVYIRPQNASCIEADKEGKEWNWHKHLPLAVVLSVTGKIWWREKRKKKKAINFADHGVGQRCANSATKLVAETRKDPYAGLVLSNELFPHQLIFPRLFQNVPGWLPRPTLCMEHGLR